MNVNENPWMSFKLVEAMTGAARLFVLLGVLSIARMLAASRGDESWVPIEILGLLFALPLVWVGRELRRAVSRCDSVAAFEQGLRAVMIGYCFRILVIVAIAAGYIYRIYG